MPNDPDQKTDYAPRAKDRPAENGPTQSGPTQSGPAKNGLEWTVFALSLALVALVVGVLVRGGGAAQDGPPRLHATLGPAEPFGEGQVRVPVTLAHDGGETVEFVTAEVTDGTQTATLDFGYTPRDTEREGSVLLDAPTGPLHVRIVAYTLP